MESVFKNLLQSNSEFFSQLRLLISYFKKDDIVTMERGDFCVMREHFSKNHTLTTNDKNKIVKAYDLYVENNNGEDEWF